MSAGRRIAVASGMSKAWAARNLTGFFSLLALTALLAACATTPPTSTTSDAVAATVDQGESDTPAVSSIALLGSPARGDTYELGETIEVRVQFDRAVTATGTPQVALTIGARTRHATLFGWGRQHLTFTYTVQEEDRDEDGVSIAANALALNGGTIRTTVGAIDVDLTHGPVTVERGNKVNGRNSTPPGVREIAFNSFPARGGTYELGETIEVRVEFDRAVTIGGEPQVALTIGTQTRHATLSAWSTQSLHFEYTVQGEDRDEDGISIAANALLLNGATIKSADGSTDADLTHGPVAAGRGSTVNGGDSTPPKVRRISLISSPAKGDTYEAGETVEVVVEFDTAVKATGEPQVALTVGTQTRHATFYGWGRESLHFSYTVQEADRDEDGISIAANAVLLSGGTIKAADGTTDADLTHEALAAQRGSKVNGSLIGPPPKVKDISLISSPARGDAYGLGEMVEVVVDFDRAVTATGSPQVGLTIGTQTRYATFSAWSRQSLYFGYTVQTEDVDEDGISIAANAFFLNGGTIKAAASTIDADLTHGALAAQRGSKVNGSLNTQPGVKRVALISSPAGGDTYGLGETVEVVVDFDRAVTATGGPQVALTIGTRTRHATFSGWGSHSLYFSYTVQEEDRDEDGISIAANALVLNGGTIRTADGTTDADLVHEAVAAERGRKVDGSRVTPPAVRDIGFTSFPARGDTYELGETIELRIEFDAAVTVTGWPHVALSIGTQTRHAPLSGWGSHSLYFDYTVQRTDRDEDGISIAANALLLSGGTITNADGTAEADLTHGALAADRRSKVSGSLITPPSVWSIAFDSSPALGTTYELGETIEVRVEFDRAVQVTGSPQVALTIGTDTRQAAYALSWRDPRYAHFSYTVQEGDRDEDGVSIAANALALNGGTITHADDPTTGASIAHSGVAADLIRKVNGSLVTQPMVRALYLDNHVPPPSGDTYVRGEIVRVWVEFDRDVTVTGRPLVALTIGSQTRHATYSGYSTLVVPGGGMVVDEDVLSFDYLVQATDRDEDGISIPANALGLSSGTITHAASPAIDADLAHGAVPADPGRKVNGDRATP